MARVEGEFPKTIQQIEPASNDSIGQFEILKVEPSERTNEGTAGKQSWALRLITFEAGKTFIPPIEFAYRTEGDTSSRLAQSNPVFLTIDSVAVDVQGDIKDIKPPLLSPWRFEDFLPYLIALAVVLASGWAYYYYWKKKKQRAAAFVPLKPVIPPFQAALAALLELEDKKLWQQGKVKEYYSEATEIIRRFLEYQYGILALESTSDEILAQLKSLPPAEPLKKEFQSFFMTADLVKFAKYNPTPVEHENELRWAYDIIRTMKPVETEQSEESVEETANVR
ncbi:MAG: hypothetical protein HY088_01015 [Ignavibacteriales bacterium]|nr:hypothetical protein [Ignavibacteriales bacterium]